MSVGAAAPPIERCAIDPSLTCAVASSTSVFVLTCAWNWSLAWMSPSLMTIRLMPISTIAASVCMRSSARRVRPASTSGPVTRSASSGWPPSPYCASHAGEVPSAPAASSSLVAPAWPGGGALWTRSVGYLPARFARTWSSLTCSRPKSSTERDRFATRSAYSRSCWAVASTIALNVPVTRLATKLGKLIASTISPAAFMSASGFFAGAGGGAAGGATAGAAPGWPPLLDRAGAPPLEPARSRWRSPGVAWAIAYGSPP